MANFYQRGAIFYAHSVDTGSIFIYQQLGGILSVNPGETIVSSGGSGGGDADATTRKFPIRLSGFPNLAIREFPKL